MRSKYIADFCENDNVSEVFQIESKNLLTTRNGKPYINLSLKDKSGTISAKVWDDAETIYKQLGSSQFAEISGSVEKYQNRLQMKVMAVKVVSSENVDMADLVATSENDIESMFEEMEKICSTVKDKYLKQLLQSFLSDGEFVSELKQSPAAKMIHHSFVGGLVEHTLSVMQVCDKLAQHYGGLNRDLLLTGAFFHDMGKIHEIDSAKAFEYTREGSLVGHVVMGFEMVQRRIREIEEFPEKLRVELGHLILSHQGKLEFGAPVVPMCAEAILLHYVDDLDVRINVFRKVVAANQSSESEFIERVWPLESRIYKGIVPNGE